MKLTHHGLHVELPDEWWVEAEMKGFVLRAAAYRVDHNLFENVREVRIEEVGPGHRNPGVAIFNDSEEGGTARERVLRKLVRLSPRHIVRVLAHRHLVQFAHPQVRLSLN